MNGHKIPSVLITGCGKGGIGHALALEFKAKGYKVIATLLTHEDHTHLEDEGIHSFVADVTREEDTKRLVEGVKGLIGDSLSILVNNAGVCYTMTAIDTDVHEVEAMFAVNVFGPMRMVHHFHPFLIKARGKVVNVGSVGGVVPYVYGASYNASKAALHHWGNTLRVELRPLGVNVINVISGEVSTNILKRDQSHQRQLPETSFYHPLAAEFSNHINRIPNTTVPAEYARSVVQEVTKASSRTWFWTGSRSQEVRFCDMFLPRTYWDWLFTRAFNLQKLKSL